MPTVISKNGITIELSRKKGGTLLKVLDQSSKATRILNHYKNIIDEQTGFSIRSNKYPSFKGSQKRIFLRGAEIDKNENVVEISDKYISEAALRDSLDRMLSKVVDTQKATAADANKFVQLNKKHRTLDGKTIVGANTTLVRMAFINRAMATILRLTNHDQYPEEVIEWKKIEPIVTKNTHYNEHIGQIVDVLNKSIAKTTSNVVNPHKVSHKSAAWVVSVLKNLFAEAHKRGPGELVALWRAITGFRGPDFTD